MNDIFVFENVNARYTQKGSCLRWIAGNQQEAGTKTLHPPKVLCCGTWVSAVQSGVHWSSPQMPSKLFARENSAQGPQSTGVQGIDIRLSHCALHLFMLITWLGYDVILFRLLGLGFWRGNGDWMPFFRSQKVSTIKVVLGESDFHLHPETHLRAMGEFPGTLSNI